MAGHDAGPKLAGFDMIRLSRSAALSTLFLLQSWTHDHLTLWWKAKGAETLQKVNCSENKQWPSNVLLEDEERGKATGGYSLQIICSATEVT